MTLVYLTTNPHKMKEVETFLKQGYGIDLTMQVPDFEVLEIQASDCPTVATFSAKYAAEKLHCPVLKSDTGLYLEALGGLPGPYNSYFDKQIGIKKFLTLLKNEPNRRARLEHCYAYCEPGQKALVFSGSCSGKIARKACGHLGRWHDQFFIPEGETETLSELRQKDYAYEHRFWGTALDDFAHWYLQNKVL